MSRRFAAAAVSILLAAGTLVGISAPAAAAPPADTTPAMFAALRRDLGLTTEQAADRLAANQTATDVERRLRAQLGTRYGGTWIDASGAVVTAVTDPTAVSAVRVAGAVPRLVTNSLDALTALAGRLDRVAHRPAAVTGWHVDLVGNTVVVESQPGGAATAAAFVTGAGARPGQFRVAGVAERPRPLAYVRGGDQFKTATAPRCTVAFTVVGGFLTSGHCGHTGQIVYSIGGAEMGIFAGSSFPGNDYAWVQLYPGWTPLGEVRTGAGTAVQIKGSQVAPVGSTVCKYGSTSGWRCGTVTALNATVSYPGGTVYGLTRTSVCSEAGDSGGPFVSGNQAQGILSGGSGNCTTGGTSYFQPVREALSAYGLTLLTS